MIWQIVKAEQLPFGKRVLRRGCRGEDVKELQQRLAADGFYYGAPDGCYGVLTEEAVCLLQQTFKLRRDGLAGPAVVAALARNSVKTGRIIYTVKPGDQLHQISDRFGVLPMAWRRIPGNRPGVRRLYPGQRLLLYQKAFFIWENDASVLQNEVTVPATGLIVNPPAADGIESSNLSSATRCSVSRYYLCNLATVSGPDGQLPLESCVRLIRQTVKVHNGKIGLDLRMAPSNTLFFRNGWLKKCLRLLGWQQIPFVLLSLTITPRGVRQLFWAQLDWISRYTKMILIEPGWDESTTETLQASFQQWDKMLSRFARICRRQPLMPVLPTHAWSWDEELGVRHVPLPEARRIRALYNQSSVSGLKGGLTLSRYLSQGKQQMLLCREPEWWEKLLQQVVKSNFAGLTIRDFGALGEEGRQLIAATFSVLPESWF